MILELVLSILKKWFIQVIYLDAHKHFTTARNASSVEDVKKTQKVSTNATKHSFMKSNILIQHRYSRDMTL